MMRFNKCFIVLNLHWHEPGKYPSLLEPPCDNAETVRPERASFG
jgi:hypothetical protein